MGAIPAHKIMQLRMSSQERRQLQRGALGVVFYICLFLFYFYYQKHPDMFQADE